MSLSQEDLVFRCINLLGFSRIGNSTQTFLSKNYYVYFNTSTSFSYGLARNYVYDTTKESGEEACNSYLLETANSVNNVRTIYGELKRLRDYTHLKFFIPSYDFLRLYYNDHQGTSSISSYFWTDSEILTNNSSTVVYGVRMDTGEVSNPTKSGTGLLAIAISAEVAKQELTRLPNLVTGDWHIKSVNGNLIIG